MAMVFYLLMTTLALYAVERFAASDSAAGLAASMFVVGATAGRLFAGNLVELVGRRRILLVCLGVFVVSSLSYFLATTLTLLLVVRFVHGVAFGIGTTAVVTIAQSIIPPLRRGEGTGFFGMSTTLGTALGPFLGLLIVDRSGYTALFAASVVASAAALAVALFLRVPEPVLAGEHRAALRRFRPADLLDRRVLPLAAFMLVMGAGFSGVLTFLSTYTEQLGLPAAASLFFLVYAGVLFVSRFVVGRLQDVRGDNLVMYPAIVSFVLGLVVLAVATGVAAIVLAGALMGLGFGTLMSAGQAIAVARVAPHRMGLAVSTYFFMVDIGTGLGPVALGWLVQGTSFRTMYLAMAGVVLLAAGLYHLVHGRSRRGQRPRTA
ncbi:MFS transporter [Georgenia subflava]|uniref:MFS transporter n=2 Tax=Georgenia subflava TaxID=1622177 RepID=A0A6N7EGF8_9MICO|nr:MFS transporter [Georgenia subflava]